MIINQQHFSASGTWFRPGDASFVDVTLSGAVALWPSGYRRSSGDAPLTSQRYPASDLPQEVKIAVSEPDGYAIIITHRL